MRVIRSRPESVAGPAAWFTGTVWFDPIATGVSPSRLAAISVHFTPGARTAWHAHPNGQILHVLEGTGRTQLRGEPVEEIRAGDTVIAEAGEWHWHGAAPGNFMTHLALQEHGDDGAHAEWGEHVSEAEYLSASAQPSSR